MKKYLMILIGFYLSGCGTIMSHIEGDGYSGIDHETLPRVYSGAILDSRCFYHPEYSEPNNVEFLCLVDFPFSFILDTALLPYTVYRQIADGNYGSSKVGKEGVE